MSFSADFLPACRVLLRTGNTAHNKESPKKDLKEIKNPGELSGGPVGRWFGRRGHRMGLIGVRTY